MPDQAVTVAGGGGQDRIGGLPDEVLNHILFFLPSDDAVRTCALGQRWRNLWRSTRALRITRSPHDSWGRQLEPYWRPWTLNSFVNSFHLLRGGAPLYELEVACGEIFSDDANGWYTGASDDVERRHQTWERSAELSRSVRSWIHRALTFCQTKLIRFSLRIDYRRLKITDVVFISGVLARVDLIHVKLKYYRSMDFSRCPALQELNMTCCVVVDVGGILSPSLRHLSITGCDFHRSTRCRILAPRLTSLQLVVFYGRAPFLEEMPLLVNGNVRLEDCSCADICKNKRYYGDCGDDNCRGCFGSRGDGSSVLLQGLSSATDLKLTSYPNVFILRKDFKFCTTFSNLKTLLVNEWCLKPGFGAVDYFLQNSPVMEKLTIQLENCFLQHGHDVVLEDENDSPREYILASKRLRTVKIKWYQQYKMVEKVLKILTTYGVPTE